MKTDQKVVTRFAPSPTGTLHTGGARTALVDYLFARQNGGRYILRIDDTDKQRSTKEYEEDIISNLHWLGIIEDEIHHQSDRVARHKFFLQKLIDEDRAYISAEEVKEAGQSPSVIRFRNPNKVVKFSDAIRGEVAVDTTDLGDFIIAKDLETPLYHFASIVDDFELGVTHVIRAEEHLSNTPRQILMWEAIGAPLPSFSHLPLILAPDRSKLSKRKHADIASVTEFRKKGYLPEAIVNYIAFLGWNPGTDQEIMSMGELIEQFDLAKMQKGGAVFNSEKLDWYNREYLRRLPASEYLFSAEPFMQKIKALPHYSEERFLAIRPIIQDRIYALGEIENLFEQGDLEYFFEPPAPEPALLKDTQFLPTAAKLIEAVPDEQFNANTVKTAFWDFATEKGRGAVLWPLRVALTGREKSPDPFTVAGIIGKTETLNRINNALKL
jgi:glutamyl-tRNA synthetase